MKHINIVDNNIFGINAMQKATLFTVQTDPYFNITFLLFSYRAADWKLDSPDWISRMKVMAIGKECFICIEDKNSGELFAKAPIPSYPGEAVESVLDSSRYFVIRIEDESGMSLHIYLFGLILHIYIKAFAIRAAFNRAV